MVVCDGKSLVTYTGLTNCYYHQPAPRSLMAASMPILRFYPEFNSVALGKLCYGTFADHPSVTVGPPARLHGEPCDTLVARYIALGESRETETFTFDRKSHLMCAYAGMSNHLDKQSTPWSRHTRTFDLVDAHPTFTDADFTFTPPPGAKEIPGPK